MLGLPSSFRQNLAIWESRKMESTYISGFGLTWGTIILFVLIIIAISYILISLTKKSKRTNPIINSLIVIMVLVGVVTLLRFMSMSRIHHNQEANAWNHHYVPRVQINDDGIYISDKPNKFGQNNRISINKNGVSISSTEIHTNNHFELQQDATVYTNRVKPPTIPNIWKKGIEDSFAIITHHSLLTACNSLLDEIFEEKAVEKLLRFQSNPFSLEINTPQDSQLPPEAIEFIEEKLNNRFKNIDISHSNFNSNFSKRNLLNDSSNPQSSKIIFLTINFHIDDQAMFDDAMVSQSLFLKFDLASKYGTYSNNRNLYNKPWLNDYSDFSNQHPNDNWLVAYSQTSHTDPQHAKLDAEQQVVAVFNNEIGDYEEFADIRPATFEEIERNDFIADRFSQQLQGNTGTSIWREAILMKVNQDDQLDNLAYQIQEDMNEDISQSIASNRSIRNHVLSLAGLFGLIFGLYLFLNYATKGYYSIALRVMAVVCVSIILILVWMNHSAARF